MQTKDKLAKMEHVKIAHDHVDFTDRIKKGTGTGALITGDLEHNTAEGVYSHAEGYGTHATESYSHSEGINSTASGGSSHAEGGGTTASGTCAHAEGTYTKASGVNQHVSGQYNIEDTNDTYAEIIGNGSAGSPSNARTLDWNGNEVLAGKLTVGAGPTANMDVATKQYVDGMSPEKYGFAYATCPTAKTTAAKVGICPNYVKTENGFVAVKFDNNVLANATLNINNQGACPLYYRGLPLKTYVILGNDIALFVLKDGKYHLIGVDKIRLAPLGFGSGSCYTEAEELAKVASIGQGGFEPQNGGIVLIYFGYDVPANSTLNVQGSGDLPIKIGGMRIQDGMIFAGDLVTFMYSSYWDTNAWQVLSIIHEPSA